MAVLDFYLLITLGARTRNASRATSPLGLSRMNKQIRTTVSALLG